MVVRNKILRLSNPISILFQSNIFINTYIQITDFYKGFSGALGKNVANGAVST